MRNPCIHIRLSHLVKVLKDLGYKDCENKAEQILIKAVPYSIESRYQVTGNARINEQVKRVVSAARNNEITVASFNVLLSTARRAAGHKHFREITQADKQDFAMLRDISALAVDFAKICGFEDYVEGCKVYLTLGLEIMGKKSSQYGLNKFKSYDSKIYQAYEARAAIYEDDDVAGTRQMCDLYMLLLAEYAGISRDDLTEPNNYTSFLQARLEADKVEANYEDWLRAQFEEMGRMFDTVPELNQIYTEGAVKRYYAYIAGGSRKATLESEVITPKQTEDEFMKKYNERLKSKNK